MIAAITHELVITRILRHLMTNYPLRPANLAKLIN